MQRRDCFGSIQEVVFRGDLTMTQTRPECRECQDMRACLNYVRERDELRKQTMIAQIIDLSRILSNEVGSCLLEVLSRMYSSPLGLALFKNLFLFFEVPRDSVSHTWTIPISSSVMDLTRGGTPADEPEGYPKRFSKSELILRIILIQRHFGENRKANIGLLAHEIARVFSSDDQGIRQIMAVLAESEVRKFKQLDPDTRTKWLVEMWGFHDELEAFRIEREILRSKKKG